MRRLRIRFQPGGEGKGEGWMFQGEGETEIHHGLMSVRRDGEGRDQEIGDDTAELAHAVLPEAVAG